METRICFVLTDNKISQLATRWRCVKTFFLADTFRQLWLYQNQTKYQFIYKIVMMTA